MRQLRILITGAGGPAAIAFMRSLRHDAIEFIAADIDPYAAGLYLVPEERRAIVLPGASPGFVEQLLALCVSRHVDVLVPTVDCELVAIAAAQARFEAAHISVLLASESSLRSCLDKYATLRALAGVVDLPRSALFDEAFDDDGWQYPLLVKPRSASGSRGVVRIDTPQDLRRISRSAAQLVQEFLPGPEYSVDVLCNRSGAVVAAVPRARLKVDSGISVTGYSFHDEHLQAAASRVATALGLRYVSNVQFRTDAAGVPRLLEVNPRFPGAMPLTVASGIHMPKLAVAMAIGVDCHWVPDFDDTAIVRFWDEQIITRAQLTALETERAQLALPGRRRQETEGRTLAATTA